MASTLPLKVCLMFINIFSGPGSDSACYLFTLRMTNWLSGKYNGELEALRGGSQPTVAAWLYNSRGHPLEADDWRQLIVIWPGFSVRNTLPQQVFMTE